MASLSIQDLPKAVLPFVGTNLATATFDAAASAGLANATLVRARPRRKPRRGCSDPHWQPAAFASDKLRTHWAWTASLRLSSDTGATCTGRPQIELGRTAELVTAIGAFGRRAELRAAGPEKAIAVLHAIFQEDRKAEG